MCVCVCVCVIQVRLYDVRAKRRPIFNVTVGDTGMDTSRCRFTCMALDGAGRTLMLGDVVGGITRFDLRKRMGWGSFKGGHGAVRDMVCEGEHVAACFADRFVRVYDLSSRKLLHKVYMKQRLSALLLHADEAAEAAVEDKPAGPAPAAGPQPAAGGGAAVSAPAAMEEEAAKLTEM